MTTDLAPARVQDLGDGTSLMTFENITLGQARMLEVMLRDIAYRDRRRNDAPAAENVRGTLSVDDAAMPMPAESMPVLLSWIAEDRIPATHRAFVRKHVDRAARMLGIEDELPIRWFGPPIGGGDFWGPSAGPGTIPTGFSDASLVALLGSLRGDKLVETIAHECRHVAQHRLRAVLDDRYFQETDAERFALDYLRTVR